MYSAHLIHLYLNDYSTMNAFTYSLTYTAYREMSDTFSELRWQPSKYSSSSSQVTCIHSHTNCHL